ncbi:MAG: hypothetical protein HC837_11670 [Chloroflexaceae bacterium]|nr:hypothetical protein [Chloroflexaceae bacterium]
MTLLMRHALRKHQLDSDPGWIGPKYQTGFQQLSNYGERRAVIQQARNRGSVPPDVVVQLRRAIKAGALQVRQAEVAEAFLLDSGAIQLVLADHSTPLESDCVVLATGFAPQRPGGRWLDAAVAALELPVAPCGYPIVDATLRWTDGLYVMGPLAELEIGPVARNITGARQAAERIVQATAERMAQSCFYRAMGGRAV